MHESPPPKKKKTKKKQKFTCPISHSAPICNKNVHTRAHTFLFQNGELWDIYQMHYGICAAVTSSFTERVL